MAKIASFSIISKHFLLKPSQNLKKDIYYFHFYYHYFLVRLIFINVEKSIDNINMIKMTMKHIMILIYLCHSIMQNMNAINS